MAESFFYDWGKTRPDRYLDLKQRGATVLQKGTLSRWTLSGEIFHKDGVIIEKRSEAFTPGSREGKRIGREVM